MAANDLISRFSPGSSFYFAEDFDFNQSAQEVFHYQVEDCQVYQTFLRSFGWNLAATPDLNALPFLPIEAFKSHPVQSGTWAPHTTFRSSGTQGVRSQHLVRSVTDYLDHATQIFTQYFGQLSDFRVLALLPNYLEAGDSSLVQMVSGFMARSGQPAELFFLHDFVSLRQCLESCVHQNKRILLFGVTFALLDFAKAHAISLPSNSLIIETGGMKGRGEELERGELHAYLAAQFSLPHIYSEYGMTELMSQAYSNDQGRYRAPASMQIQIREINDPLAPAPLGKVGIIHVIDLANLHTCAFIATGDLGIKYADGTFAVVGRLDNTDLRGCHLMYL